MTGSVSNLRRHSSLFALLLVAGCASVDTVTGEGDGLGSGNASSSSGGSGPDSSGGSNTGGAVSDGGAGAIDAGGTGGTVATAGTGGTGGTGGPGGTGDTAGTGGVFQCTMTVVFGTNAPISCDPCILQHCCEEAEGCFRNNGCMALNTCAAEKEQACVDEANATNGGQAAVELCLSLACPDEWTTDARERMNKAYGCVRTECELECYP